MRAAEVRQPKRGTRAAQTGYPLRAMGKGYRSISPLRQSCLKIANHRVEPLRKLSARSIVAGTRRGSSPVIHLSTDRGVARLLELSVGLLIVLSW